MSWPGFTIDLIGPGTFTLEAAWRTGSEEKLIAIDFQAEVIAQVENRVREAGVTNVEST